jgi:hypothetical protein
LSYFTKRSFGTDNSIAVRAKPGGQVFATATLLAVDESVKIQFRNVIPNPAIV